MTIWFLTLNSIKGQETILYHSDGTLKFDNSLKVDIKDRKAIIVFEEYLLPDIYSNIEYPILAVENAIEGSLICKIKFSKPDILEISFLKSVDKMLEIATNNGIRKIEDRICRYLNSNSKNESLEIFLPVIFEIEKNVYKENLENKKCIVIKKEETTMQKMLLMVPNE
jgi:hypothetical protein